MTERTGYGSGGEIIDLIYCPKCGFVELDDVDIDQVFDVNKTNEYTCKCGTTFTDDETVLLPIDDNIAVFLDDELQVMKAEHFLDLKKFGVKKIVILVSNARRFCDTIIGKNIIVHNSDIIIKLKDKIVGTRYFTIDERIEKIATATKTKISVNIDKLSIQGGEQSEFPKDGE